MFETASGTTLVHPSRAGPQAAAGRSPVCKATAFWMHGCGYGGDGGYGAVLVDRACMSAVVNGALADIAQNSEAGSTRTLGTPCSNPALQQHHLRS